MGQLIDSLDEEHRKLDEKIHEEEQHAYPDQLKINELKKEKLRIKDEIARATHA